MATEDSCYGIVDEENLEQGDLIEVCPVFIPDYPLSLIEQLAKGEIDELIESTGEWQFFDAVVMSQTCDLENGKLKYVTMCPFWSLDDFGAMGPDFRSPKTLEDIRRGNRPSYHMLDACNLDEKKQGIQVVDFRSVFSVPYSFLKSFAGVRGKRLRLLSPYKEDLAQAFGKFFMRVARPKSIQPFRK